MIRQQKAGVRVGADGGEAIWFNGGLCIVKADHKSTDGRLAAVEFRVPAGFASPVHVHHHDDELFVVQAGEVRFRVGDDIVEASAGSIVYGPREVNHAFIADSDAQLLLVFTPAGTEKFFREAGRPAGRIAYPPEDEPRLDRETLAKLAAAHGQDIVGPPLEPKV